MSRMPKSRLETRSRIYVDSTVVAVIAAVLLLFPSIVWIFRDQQVWPWDQAYYAWLALRIRDAADHGLLAWLSAFLTVPDSRAPLLPWLAQATTPLMDVLGGPERAFLLTNIAASGVTLWLVYATTRRLGGSRSVALVAMLLCSSTSDFIAFNHQFLVETVQAMAVAGVAWIALKADRLSWLRLGSGALFWVTLALLAKTTSIGYVAPFLLYIGIVCCATLHHPRPAAKAIDFLLALGVILLAAVAVAWYVMRWPRVVRHVIEATNSDIVFIYGSAGPLVVKLQFWSRELLRALSPFPLLAGLVLLICAIALGLAAARQVRGAIESRWRSAIDSGLLFALCLAGTILAGLLAYSRAIAEDPRYLAPMIPLVVLLFSWSLVALGRRWLTAGAAVLLAINWVATHAVAQGLVALPGLALGYLYVPQIDRPSIERLTRAVQEGCSKSRPDRVNIIGAELPNFSAVSAWFYAEKMHRTLGYRCNYTSLGYLEKDVSRATKTLFDTDADFFVTLPLNELPMPETNPFDRVSRAVAEWIATSPDFERVTPEGDSLVVYRRRR